MREILFRGKRVDNGEWIFGSYHKVDNDISIIINHTGTNLSHATLVIPESVGQFTGLTDKNGKKIFEGDILNDGDRPWSVKQLSGGCWALDYANGSGEKYLYPINKHIEIIGNIHDK